MRKSGRNRLSSLDAVNKRKVGEVLEQLAKRISFKVAPGFSERVIFRELFLQGLTLLLDFGQITLNLEIESILTKETCIN